MILGKQTTIPRSTSLHLTAQLPQHPPLPTGVASSQKEMLEKVTHTIETMIGKIARPKRVHVVPDMPKTRSGKLMRRVLAAISNNMNVGDITTLANPDIVEQIRVQVQGAAPVQTQEGPEDVKQFGSVE